jgi:hypothetical protein
MKPAPLDIKLALALVSVLALLALDRFVSDHFCLITGESTKKEIYASTWRQHTANDGGASQPIGGGSNQLSDGDRSETEGHGTAESRAPEKTGPSQRREDIARCSCIDRRVQREIVTATSRCDFAGDQANRCARSERLPYRGYFHGKSVGCTLHSQRDYVAGNGIKANQRDAESLSRKLQSAIVEDRTYCGRHQALEPWCARWSDDRKVLPLNESRGGRQIILTTFVPRAERGTEPTIPFLITKEGPRTAYVDGVAIR